MSFFEDASLVYIPAAVRNGKTYSIKPTDGTGDLTFTRASSATRVGPNGYIEKVRENVTLYSQEFQNSSGWFSIDINVTANAATAPDGTTTADKLVPNTDNSAKMIYNPYGNLASVGEYSLSVYVKAAGYSKVGLRESQSVGFYATFDLSNGTIIDSDTDQVNTITSVGDGWYRITSTRSYTGNISIGILPLDDSYTSGQPFGYSYIGDGTSGILAWGAQTEHGVPTEYIKTEAAAVSVGPVSGTPRLDYLGSDCGRLLLEPQRSNVVPYSEQLSQWSLTNATLTSNDAISPDGYQNADKIVTTSAGCDVKYTNVSVSASTTYTASFWVKLTSGSGLQGRFYDNTNSTNIEYYTYDSQLTIGEWSRVTRTFTTPAGCTNIQVWYLAASSSSSVTAHFWGFQLEAGAYATSYIPTLGTAVTRVAETALKTSVSSLIGASAGVVYFEGTIEGEGASTRRVISISDGTNANYLLVYNPAGTRGLDFVTAIGGVVQCNITSSSSIFQYGQRFKMAFAYAQNDFAFYINGTQIGIDGNGNIPSGLDRIIFGRGDQNSSVFFEGNVSQTLLFKTRLTNAQLAELTSL